MKKKLSVLQCQPEEALQWLKQADTMRHQIVWWTLIGELCEHEKSTYVILKKAVSLLLDHGREGKK